MQVTAFDIKEEEIVRWIFPKVIQELQVIKLLDLFSRYIEVQLTVSLTTEASGLGQVLSYIIEGTQPIHWPASSIFFMLSFYFQYSFWNRFCDEEFGV